MKRQPKQGAVETAYLEPESLELTRLSPSQEPQVLSPQPLWPERREQQSILGEIGLRVRGSVYRDHIMRIFEEPCPSGSISCCD